MANKIKQQHILKGATQLVASDSGATDDYSRGVIIGLVSGLMAQGWSYDEAIAEVSKALPDVFFHRRLPPAWLTDLLDNYRKYKGTT